MRTKSRVYKIEILQTRNQPQTATVYRHYPNEDSARRTYIISESRDRLSKLTNILKHSKLFERDPVVMFWSKGIAINYFVENWKAAQNDFGS